MLKIGVVGPCAAGKSTLIARLRQAGYQAKHIAQEHSYVKDMWLRMTKPDVLIYLEVSYQVTIQRRKLNWTVAEYTEQLNRLVNARQHAHLVIYTDPLTPDQVFSRAVNFLNEIGHSPGSGV